MLLAADPPPVQPTQEGVASVDGGAAEAVAVPAPAQPTAKKGICWGR